MSTVWPFYYQAYDWCLIVAVDKIVACTTPTYAWIGLLGFIPAVVVAGVYGDRAAKMAARIDEVRNLIDRYEHKIKSETQVVGDLRAIEVRPA